MIKKLIRLNLNLSASTLKIKIIKLIINIGKRKFLFEKKKFVSCSDTPVSPVKW